MSDDDESSSLPRPLLPARLSVVTLRERGMPAMCTHAVGTARPSIVAFPWRRPWGKVVECPRCSRWVDLRDEAAADGDEAGMCTMSLLLLTGSLSVAALSSATVSGGGTASRAALEPGLPW